MAPESSKGYLSLFILWTLRKQHMTGAEISAEIAIRKGSRPSPGTIYPALKELKARGFIRPDKEKRYALTAKGAQELEQSLQLFCTMFSDFNEMKSCCRKC
ncbi:MAG TPA: PadR family transcriptional regulator [Candidatus Nanoarchaeia archaeon]|nr:PadR family transcriptional regulator [Candidatus Nanoarchaeia archaeon]